MWDHFLSQHWAQLSPDLPLDEFVRYAERQGDYPAEIIDGIFMHRRIDVMTDNLAEVKEARAPSSLCASTALKSTPCTPNMPKCRRRWSM
ncbi:ACP phosphodiesterase, partial [Klebsiella pneumoniae]